jgi:Arc/MetJ family transcription regulator
VAKTLVDIDEDLLSRAVTVLGATTKKDAVNWALQEVVGRDDRARGLAWLSSTSALADLSDPEVVRAARL